MCCRIQIFSFMYSLWRNASGNFWNSLHLKKIGTYPPRNIDHDFLLMDSDFTSLTAWRKFHCVVYLLKLLRNIVDSQFLISRIPLAVPQWLSRHHSYFYIPVIMYRQFTRHQYIICVTSSIVTSLMFSVTFSPIHYHPYLEPSTNL